MKAFPVELIATSTGSCFVEFETGFDITFIKKSIYMHFLSIGFKEFYMKTYLEFLYLYNTYF